jgi:hypothetical protein
MKIAAFIFVFLAFYASSLGQAVGTPYIFGEIKAPYVYQNVVTTYDCSTLSGWINGYDTYNQLSIDATIGNPAPCFKSIGGGIRTIRRDFGQSFKNKTIEFDVYLKVGNFGFNIGSQEAVNGYYGISLLMAPGNSTISGLNNSSNWFYPNYGPDTKNFNANQWYAVKIVAGDGGTGTIKWYVDGVLQGTNGSYAILGDYTFFGVASYDAAYYIDNIKISY